MVARPYFDLAWRGDFLFLVSRDALETLFQLSHSRWHRVDKQ
jgi:hypothetical protein